MDSTAAATASFEIDLGPAAPLIDGTGRFDFAKTWTGALQGTSTGTMLSAGDPSTGHAGYVALEVFTGTITGRAGTLTLQQYGRMAGAEPVLVYASVPGSGTGGLREVSGILDLHVDDAGAHHVTWHDARP